MKKIEKIFLNSLLFTCLCSTLPSKAMDEMGGANGGNGNGGGWWFGRPWRFQHVLNVPIGGEAEVHIPIDLTGDANFNVGGQARADIHLHGDENLRIPVNLGGQGEVRVPVEVTINARTFQGLFALVAGITGLIILHTTIKQILNNHTQPQAENNKNLSRRRLACYALGIGSSLGLLAASIVALRRI